jgi:uncharacterized protein
MKKSILTSLLSLFTLIGHSQYDDKFYFPSRKMEKIDSLNYESLSFKIDKDILTGIFIKPVNTAKATVVYFHGAGGNISTYLDFIRPLVKNNFQVIMIDFRGYGRSTGIPTHKNIAADAQVIFNEVSSRKEVQSKPLIVYGASMGTQVAANLTKNNQSKIKALVLDGPLSSFTDIAVESSPQIMKKLISEQVTSPYSAKEDIKEINRVKVLVIHSKEDKSIPYDQGKIVFENANQPKSFWLYKGDHLEAPLKYPADFINKFNELLQ